MKTISIEIADKFYNAFKNFLKILPKDSFIIHEDELDELTIEERNEIYRLKNKMDKGDYSDFEKLQNMKDEN